MTVSKELAMVCFVSFMSPIASFAASGDGMQLVVNKTTSPSHTHQLHPHKLIHKATHSIKLHHPHTQHDYSSADGTYYGAHDATPMPRHAQQQHYSSADGVYQKHETVTSHEIHSDGYSYADGVVGVHSHHDKLTSEPDEPVYSMNDGIRLE